MAAGGVLASHLPVIGIVSPEGARKLSSELCEPAEIPPWSPPKDGNDSDSGESEEYDGAEFGHSGSITQYLAGGRRRSNSAPDITPNDLVAQLQKIKRSSKVRRTVGSDVTDVRKAERAKKAQQKRLTTVLLRRTIRKSDGFELESRVESLKERVTLDQEEMVEDIQDSSGYLIDYILRTKAMLDADSRKAAIADPASQALPRMLNNMALADFGEYKYAGSRIFRERLKCTLMESIIAECKERFIFDAVGPSRFWRRAEQVRVYKREAMCLRVEVDNWILRYKLLHNKPPQMGEGLWERKARLEEFWTVYHRRQIDEPDASSSPSMRRNGSASRLEAEKKAYAYPPRSSTQGQTLGRKKTLKAEALGNTQSSLGNTQSSLANSQSLPSLRDKSRVVVSFTEKARELQRPGDRSGATSNKTFNLPPLSAQRHRYLKECDIHRQVPTPLAFVTGHSKNFEAAGRDLVDSELLAMAGMLKETHCMEEVNLNSNSLLSDKGLVPFIEQLHHEPVVTTLQRLNLGSCARAGTGTMKATVQLLSVALAMRHVDLSHVQLATRLQIPLCQALGSHPNITSVSLADTGLHGVYGSSSCISHLLNSQSLETLDLGWNCFTAETFASLGEHLVKNGALKNLFIANCSATVDEGDTPVSFFLECLSRDSSLVKLDVSMNRIDHNAFLILEDSLENHPKLAELNVSHNALGVFGVRSALRLLSRSSNALMNFNAEGCYSGRPQEEVGMDDSNYVFQATNPGGKYVLNLARPCHRALLRLLYKSMERFQLPPEEAFVQISYTVKSAGQSGARPKEKKKEQSPSYSHPPKDAFGVRQIPTAGTLTCVFSVWRTMEYLMQGGVRETDFNGFLEKYFAMMRSQPGWKKAIPMFAKWKQLDGRMLEQQVYLDSIAKDFNLSITHLAQLCTSNRAFTMEILWRLMPCLPHNEASKYLGAMIAPTLNTFLWCYQRMQSLLEFNAQNPTGHYKLQLENCCDFAVAERLLLLDRWEAALDLKHGRFDTTMLGNRSHFRNELYQGRPLIPRYNSVAEWTLPEFAEFEFDYVTNQRPPAGARHLSDELWEHVMITMYDSPCSPEDKIAVLRSISHHFWLCALHIRKMLGYFRTEEQRAECFVIFYFRLTDVVNQKVCRVRFPHYAEVKRLQERMGYASFFPFMQPEGTYFELDLARHDQRLCSNLYISMSVKEKRENIRNPSYVAADGTVDPLPLGVPLGWQDFNKMPKSGIFKGQYVCSPDDKKFEIRKKNLETFGYFPCSQTEEDVLWTTGLLDPPGDVIKFLEFLITEFLTVDDVFTRIDGGEGGNGELSLQEVQAGIKEMNIPKLKGKDESQRIGIIFRYLDPGGEGTISRLEFRVLDQLWKEFDRCVREFTHFLSITFGKDFQDIWDNLFPDMEEIDQQYWLQAVEDIGYFGPAAIVFDLLDHSGDGNISYDEFEVLKHYMSP